MPTLISLRKGVQSIDLLVAEHPKTVTKLFETAKQNGLPVAVTPVDQVSPEFEPLDEYIELNPDCMEMWQGLTNDQLREQRKEREKERKRAEYEAQQASRLQAPPRGLVVPR